MVKYKIKYSTSKFSESEKNNFICVYTSRASKLPNSPQERDFRLIVNAFRKCQLSA